MAILDRTDQCSDIELTASVFRRSRSGTTCEQGIQETDTTVVAPDPALLRLDPDSTSHILAIRSESAGAGFGHEFAVQWKLSRLAWDSRFRPRLDPGRGPTLVCSKVACRVFAEGEPLPPSERSVCGIGLDGGTASLSHEVQVLVQGGIASSSAHTMGCRGSWKPGAGPCRARSAPRLAVEVRP